jgi:hypothetical protein
MAPELRGCEHRQKQHGFGSDRPEVKRQSDAERNIRIRYCPAEYEPRAFRTFLINENPMPQLVTTSMMTITFSSPVFINAQSGDAIAEGQHARSTTGTRRSGNFRGKRLF